MGKIAIIGGGLAGTACAYLLKQNGYQPVIFEAGDGLASGASGNPVGLYNPRFYAIKLPEAEFYERAYQAVSKLFAEIGSEIDHSPHGSLHLAATPEKQKRFAKMKESWGWEDAEMQILSNDQASKVAGIDLKYGGMFLSASGTVAPDKLCEYYARSCETRLKKDVKLLIRNNDSWSLSDENFDHVILACGANVARFSQTDWLPIYSVRGQIAQFEQSVTSQKLRCNINYGGYITPSLGGVHTCGSTFQKWLQHTDILEQDTQDILDKMHEYIPYLSDVEAVMSARASLRTASKDRLPIIGAVPCKSGDINIKNLYVSTAHGSHGIVTSYLAACMIMREIEGTNACHLAKHVSASRFLK